MISSIGTAFGLITLGFYMMLKSWGVDIETFNWIPITSFSFVILIASFALLTLPFLVISEVMPEKIKDFGVSFCMSFSWFITFAMVRFLPNLIDLLGFPGTMYSCALFCIFGAIFVIIYVPETKGKSYEQIMNSL